MQDNADRAALNPFYTGRDALIPLELNETQVRYLLSLIEPIVSALESSEQEEGSLAWQIERVLDSELLAYEEATPELGLQHNDGKDV